MEVGAKTTAGAQQAVSIPEIVGYILSFVDTEDVRRAALVCHAWSSSSLPFIWETLRSLLPLLRILSRLKKLNDGQWEPAGKPESWEWERFWERARQVRSLQLVSHISATSLSTRVLTLLKSNLPPSQHSILPNIRQLCWFGMSESSISQFLDFLSPSLRGVRFVLGGYMDIKDGNSALAQLASRKDIVLQDFYVGTLYDAVQHEAPSPCLGKHWDLQSLTLPPLRAGDSVLESLKYQANLQILMVEILPSTSEDTQFILSKIAKAFPRLRKLEVVFASPWFTYTSIRFETLFPLLECQFIEELTLVSSYGVEITEEDVKAIGQFWPRLRRLNTYPLRDHPGFPLSLLLAFAKYTSGNLQDLDTPLSCNGVPPLPDPPIRISGLTTLHVRQCSVESRNLRAVAKFLAAVLSRTTTIEYHDGYPLSHAEKTSWGRVIELVDLERNSGGTA